MGTTNHYETTFVVSGKTPQESVETIVEKVKKIISTPPSRLSLVENEGLKKLAYPIKGNYEGYYIYCEYNGTGAVVSEVENFLRINDSVIRYLTVIKTKPSKVKPRKPRPIEKKPAAETTASSADSVSESGS